MKWRLRYPLKRLHVKVKPLKLEGITRNEEEDDKKIVLIEMVWRGPKPSLVSFHVSSSSRHKWNRSSEKILGNEESIEWDDDEFDNLCDFPVVSKDLGFGSWDVLFDVLLGKNCEEKRKLAVAGKVSLDLAKLVSEMECSEIERKLPITLNVNGVVIEATLSILVSFAEVRDTTGGAQNSTESNKEDGFFKMVKRLTRRKEKKNNYQLNSFDFDESLVFDSDGMNGNDSTTTSESSSGELSLGPELESSRNLETQLVPAQNYMVRMLSWKKRRLSFRSSAKKTELLGFDFDGHPQTCSVVDSEKGEYWWEVKELVSRNGGARLKAQVFFASFDQRSERAAGESACTALVAVIAHRLHSNHASMPTRPEFDNLITQGSSEWRKLCSNTAYTNAFPDKHFDLETVLKADVRPVTVSHEKSFTGFFSPDKFEFLKGAMSFDEIWNEIKSCETNNCQPRVYIISWNDHFFVLKVESKAYYIIDTLGERLFEGCKQAYMLKFDDSSLMYGKKKKKDDEMVICSGKECCREYIKRFLAAIAVEELEEEEKKGKVSTFTLHQRLQIDFHYSSFSSATSSSHFVF
ncbi:hypothetical protein ES319_A07G033200v1 [Gossypium barbadense]|uniref:C2 NT-type domain-containing protein n=2 Tax=Gossypium TaxID=3633 RepID=A0A2P5WNV4_GOSBA|nr:hypothetical protein ES319_A07G033200v1 [Gossypium barbadense]PPR92779.1 hypothetical protein GOBAR_AA27892 [Gossypium barbadense]TYH08671.1 hypothetical protein ES288_A07G034500v1 [Gossypium darwinii]